jgi:hypothetical protein
VFASFTCFLLYVLWCCFYFISHCFPLLSWSVVTVR